MRGRAKLVHYTKNLTRGKQSKSHLHAQVHVFEKPMTSSNTIFHSAFTIAINTEIRTDLCGKMEADAPRLHQVDVRLPNNDFQLFGLSHGFGLEVFRMYLCKRPQTDRMVARVSWAPNQSAGEWKSLPASGKIKDALQGHTTNR